MFFYFSGIKSADELDMLREAGVDRILADPIDMVRIVLADSYTGRKALDCGSYRAFKGGEEVGAGKLINMAREAEQSGSPYDFVVAKDVIGDANRSFQYWVMMRQYWDLDTPLVPVWQWGGDREQLCVYLECAQIVGIGGLVPLLNRDRLLEEKEANAFNKGREKVLRQLEKLVKQFPNRFHAFGLCWPKAITRLKPYLYSADTSIWLRGARYYELISIWASSKGTCYLAGSHYRYDDRADEWRKRESRELRRILCVESARNLATFAAE